MIDHTGQFRFDELSPVQFLGEPDLSNTEREMLRSLSDPGGPLWKVMQFFTDQIRYYAQQVVHTPLDTPENIARARDWQQRMQTLQAAHTQWEALLSAVPAKAEETKHG